MFGTNWVHKSTVSTITLWNLNTDISDENLTSKLRRVICIKSALQLSET
jgi:hypothetical protein